MLAIKIANHTIKIYLEVLFVAIFWWSSDEVAQKTFFLTKQIFILKLTFLTKNFCVCKSLDTQKKSISQEFFFKKTQTHDLMNFKNFWEIELKEKYFFDLWKNASHTFSIYAKKTNHRPFMQFFVRMELHEKWACKNICFL